MRTRLFIWFLLFQLFFLVNGCNTNTPQLKNSDIKIVIKKVTSKKFFSEINGYGRIEPVKSLDMEAKFNGVITYINTKNPIKKNEVIYKLGGPEIQLKRDELTKKYDIAKTEFNYLNSVLKRREILKKNSFLSKEEYDKTVSNFNNAKDNFARTKYNLDYFNKTIKYAAPFEGYLNNIKVKLGSEVKRNGIIGQLQDPDKLKFVGNIYSNFDKSNENLLIKIKDQIYKGKVLYYEKGINEKSGGHTIWIEIKNDKKNLLPGEYVKNTILLNPHISTAIPSSALIINKGNYYVVIDNKGFYEKKKVLIGTRSKDIIEIKSGLKNGDLVLTSGAFEVYFGNIKKNMEVAD